MSFHWYMMRKYREVRSPEGDLARDMAADRERFPKNGRGKYSAWYKLIREYLEKNRACEACLAVFERCWKEYLACEKSRTSKTGRNQCRTKDITR